jgi:hypothetical protein
MVEVTLLDRGGKPFRTSGLQITWGNRSDIPGLQASRAGAEEQSPGDRT